MIPFKSFLLSRSLTNKQCQQSEGRISKYFYELIFTSAKIPINSCVIKRNKRRKYFNVMCAFCVLFHNKKKKALCSRLLPLCSRNVFIAHFRHFSKVDFSPLSPALTSTHAQGNANTIKRLQSTEKEGNQTSCSITGGSEMNRRRN